MRVKRKLRKRKRKRRNIRIGISEAALLHADRNR